jgi:hypothetical protein
MYSRNKVFTKKRKEKTLKGNLTTQRVHWEHLG